MFVIIIDWQKTTKKKDKLHVKNSIDFFYSEKKDDIPVKVINASKSSSYAEYLVNNLTYANSCNLNRFKIIKQFRNVFYLIKL